MSETQELLAHSPLGASSASRWMACPGSVRLSKGIESRSSEFAEEGTRAHELAELKIRAFLNGFDPDSVAKRDAAIRTNPPDMDEATNVYAEFLFEAAADFEETVPVIFLEKKFHLESLHPLLYGTADLVVYYPEKKHLLVADYKHGAGVPVEVGGNKQGMYYAIGAMMELGQPVDTVEIAIIQPRCFHEDGPVRRWELDAVELLEFAGELYKAAVATEKEDAPVVPGSHCRWCPARGVCPGLAEQANKVARNTFSKELSYDPKVLSDTLQKLDQLEAYIAGVREFAYIEASKGIEIPGWKLVPKRASRKWVSEEEAIAKIKTLSPPDAEKAFERKLKTPAQLEKAISKDEFKKLETVIVAVSSGNTLVPESSSRKAVKDVASEVFNEHLKQQNILE